MLLLEPLIPIKIVTLDGVLFNLVRASDDQTLYWQYDGYLFRPSRRDNVERMPVKFYCEELFSRRRERLIEAPPERNHIRKIEHYLYEYREEDLQC